MKRAGERNFERRHEDFSIDEKTGFSILEFTRAAGDDSLGKTIAALASSGAVILDVETENVTLLDVLESYENEI